MVGLGGRCSIPMLQVWSHVGSQAVDGIVHESQALGLCAPATRVLIRVHTHLKFQV